MSATTLRGTPWLSISRDSCRNTCSAMFASGARRPAAVDSWAISTVVSRTMASISNVAFIPSTPIVREQASQRSRAHIRALQDRRGGRQAICSRGSRLLAS